MLPVQIQQKIRLHEGIVEAMKKKVPKVTKKQTNIRIISTSKTDLRTNRQSLDEVLGVSTFHRIVKGYIH